MCQATAEGALLKKLAFLLKVEQFCNIYIFISLFYFILKTSLFRVLLFTRERKTRPKQAVGV